MSSPDIVLISPFTDISSLSLRGISSYLKEHGFSTRMIFLSNILLSEEIDTPNWEFTYSSVVVDQVLQLCQGAKLIGVSVMTNHHYTMGHLTDQITSRLGIPVVWGGIHPTLRPEACLEHADFACVGEGEDAVVELAAAIRDERPTDTIRNISSVIIYDSPIPFVIYVFNPSLPNDSCVNIKMIQWFLRKKIRERIEISAKKCLYD